MLNINKYQNTDKVDSYLKILTKKDFDMLFSWTVYADTKVKINELIEFHNKIKNIEPVNNLTIYRGIGGNLRQQEKMDLYEKKFFMYFLKKNINVGDKFEFMSPRPLSFTDDIDTARAFGNVIIKTILPNHYKYIRITDSLWMAANKISNYTFFKEVVLLETNKPIKYEIAEINFI